MLATLVAGTVFQLTFSGGVWTETLLHVFSTENDGFFPIGGLTFDTRGNLYGVTTQGAAAGFFTAGAVFELSPAGMVFGMRKLTSIPE